MARPGPLTIWRQSQEQYKRARGRTLYIYKGPAGLLCVTTPRHEGGLFKWDVRGTPWDRLLFAGKTWFYVWNMWLGGAWR